MKLTEDGKIELEKKEIIEYMDNLEQMQLSINNKIETINGMQGEYCLLSRELFLFREKISKGLTDAEKSEWMSKQLDIAKRRGDEHKRD